MLKDYASSAIVPCADLDRAKAFYGETLGLPLIADHGNGFVFGTGTTKLTADKLFSGRGFRCSGVTAMDGCCGCTTEW